MVRVRKIVWCWGGQDDVRGWPTVVSTACASVAAAAPDICALLAALVAQQTVATAPLQRCPCVGSQHPQPARWLCAVIQMHFGARRRVRDKYGGHVWAHARTHTHPHACMHTINLAPMRPKPASLHLSSHLADSALLLGPDQDSAELWNDSPLLLCVS